MSAPANFNGQTPKIDPANAAMLLIDHQSGLFQTVKDMPMTELRANATTLAKVATLAKIPVITTGGAGGQVDPTQIQVADLNKTFNDPLAAKVRSTLRRDYNFSRTPGRTYSVPCVFSSEQLRYPKPDGTVCQSKSFVGEGVKLDCAGGFGAVMMVTATFGMVAAARAVERLAEGRALRPSRRTPGNA